MGDCHIGVFGAGIVGLNTALELQKQLRHAHITVIADGFKQDTTSDKAAGLFKPGEYFSGPTLQITHEWVDNSYYYYKGISDEIDVGIKEISGYVLSRRSRAETRNRLVEKLFPVYRTVEEDELATISPGNWKYGSYFTSYVIESRQYLPWAMKRFMSNGGEIIEGRLDSFSKVRNFGKFDVVMNCTGLGSKALCNDRSLMPVRGQVFKVKAPWIDKCYLAEDDIYIIPGIWAVTLGGTRNFGSWNTSVNKHDSAYIWEKCSEIVPKLSSTTVRSEVVGLRPHRDKVRVEPELINGLKVVHNYGHGAYGITTSPGTAQTATSIAVDLLKTTSSKL